MNTRKRFNAHCAGGLKNLQIHQEKKNKNDSQGNCRLVRTLVTILYAIERELSRHELFNKIS